MKIRTSIILIKVIFLFVLFNSCISLESCNEPLIHGKYSNHRNDGAINYIEIKPDGTYTLYYKEYEFIDISEGEWEFVDDPYCKIRVKNWKNFNEKGLDYEEIRSTIFYVSGNYLNRTPDGNTSTSFRKDSTD